MQLGISTEAHYLPNHMLVFHLPNCSHLLDNISSKSLHVFFSPVLSNQCDFFLKHMHFEANMFFVKEKN